MLAKSILKFTTYKIGGLNIKVSSTFSLESCWQIFESADNQINAEIVFCPLVSRVINRDLIYGKCKDAENIFVSNGSFVIADELFQYAYSSTYDQYINSIFLAYLFSTNALQRQMLKLHCSVIAYHGKGILFLGPSGIGKTTQAELWQEYKDAKIINGDVGFVQCMEKKILVWGTPWHGSSSYCENMCVPIVGIIVLKQGKENKMKRLSSFEMVSKVAKNVLYPTWLENGTEMALDILNQMLRQVPVYELTNRADKESVELVKQEIFGDE